MRTMLAILISLPCALIRQDAPTQGVVRGRTLTESGHPEQGVKIRLSRAENGASVKAVRYVETDASGAFVMDKLPWGTYRICTRKETAGYPDTAFGFYSNDVNPIVSIDSSRPVAEAVINLGPKAGTIDGTVVDAKTDQPVNAGVRLWRTSPPNRWIEEAVSGSKFEILVPPGVAVGMEVQAVGYDKWAYPGPNG